MRERFTPLPAELPCAHFVLCEILDAYPAEVDRAIVTLVDEMDWEQEGERLDEFTDHGFVKYVPAGVTYQILEEHGHRLMRPTEGEFPDDTFRLGLRGFFVANPDIPYGTYIATIVDSRRPELSLYRKGATHVVLVKKYKSKVFLQCSIYPLGVNLMFREDFGPVDIGDWRIAGYEILRLNASSFMRSRHGGR